MNKYTKKYFEDRALEDARFIHFDEYKAFHYLKKKGLIDQFLNIDFKMDENGNMLDSDGNIELTHIIEHDIFGNVREYWE